MSGLVEYPRGSSLGQDLSVIMADKGDPASRLAKERIQMHVAELNDKLGELNRERLKRLLLLELFPKFIADFMHFYGRGVELEEAKNRALNMALDDAAVSMLVGSPAFWNAVSRDEVIEEVRLAAGTISLLLLQEDWLPRKAEAVLGHDR